MGSRGRIFPPAAERCEIWRQLLTAGCILRAAVSIKWESLNPLADTHSQENDLLCFADRISLIRNGIPAHRNRARVDQRQLAPPRARWRLHSSRRVIS